MRSWSTSKGKEPLLWLSLLFPEGRTRSRGRKFYWGAILALAWPVRSALALGAAKPIEEGRGISLSQGALRLAGGVGYASSSETNWLMLGAGAMIQVLDGWEVGISSKAWLGGEQSLLGVGPMTRYIFVQVPEIKPYVGAFHRYYPALHSAGPGHGLGASLGVLFPIDEQLTFGGAVAYEHWLEASLMGSQHQVYPELEFSCSFDLLGRSP